MQTYKYLLEEANRTRKLFENNLVPRALLRDIYISYNPQVDIESFLDQATSLFPKLNCGLASVYLRHRLDTGEVHNGSYDGHDHTFIKLGGTIIDITADQFGGPPVYVGPLELPWSLEIKL